jgi:prepilin-type N-terminal cleavage/methylation domain-containing protein
MKTEHGFTVLEVMIALVVLGLGLLGVAAMQAKSIQGNVFGGRVTAGSAVGEAWMEWLMKQPYDNVAALDVNDDDDAATERVLDPDTVLADLQTWGLGTFTDDQVPRLEGSGCDVVWRITANLPVEHVTTVEVGTSVSVRRLETESKDAAGVVNKPVVLRFMMSPYM